MAEGKKTTAELIAEGEYVVTPIFRVSWPSLFERSAYNKKYGVTGIWTPAEFTADDKKKKAAMDALADKVAMAFHKKPVKNFPSNFKKPFRDGVEKEEFDGYGPGKIFAAMTSDTRKPNVVDRNKQAITEADDLYPGCYARALVNAYAYDKEGGKGVAFGLINVQKVRDGEPFGASRISAEESFDDDLGPEETIADDEIPF